jgi:hypothetical protein
MAALLPWRSHARTGERGSGSTTWCPACLQGLELKRHVDVTLGRGNIYDAVKLPEGEDVREWLAVNTVDMYNAVSVLYMTLIDICTDTTCPTMSAGAKVRPAEPAVAGQEQLSNLDPNRCQLCIETIAKVEMSCNGYWRGAGARFSLLQCAV